MKKDSTFIFVLLCFSGLVIIQFPAVNAEANIIVVPDDYDSIQKAVDAANDGDTVFVKGGMYNGCVLIEKSLSLIGENKETTKIVGDWELNGTAVLVRHNNVTISDITVESVIKIRTGRGIHLLQVQHCIVSNCIITSHDIGVWLYGASENIIKNNYMERKSNTYFGTGIRLQESHNNNIQNNTLQNYFLGNGIELYSSTKNYLNDNFVSNCFGGILCSKAENNTIISNYVTTGYNYATDTPDNVAPDGFGFKSEDSCNNLLASNTFFNNSNAVQLLFSSQHNRVEYNNITNSINCGLGLANNASYNLIIGNKITNNEPGLEIRECTNNILKNNDVSNNTYNIWINGTKLDHFVQDFDSSNTVEGKPVYYLVNKHNATVPLDAGHVSLVNCTNITVSGAQISNNYYGIVLAYSTNCTITKTAVIGNYYGIKLYQSANNVIAENNIKHNYWGVWLCASTLNSITNNNIQENYKYGLLFVKAPSNTITANSIQGNWIGTGFSNCLNNVIYHNNFIENIEKQVEIEKTASGYLPTGDGMQIFDKGSQQGGNYWSDYNGTDANNDGIGDTQFLVTDYRNNTDNYPLTAPVEVDAIPEFSIGVILPLCVVSALVLIGFRKKLRRENL